MHRCKPDCADCCCKPCELCLARAQGLYLAEDEDEITEVIPDVEARMRELDAHARASE